jgi:hypothetical protein
MTKVDFGLMLALVMMVFLILDALHLPFIPMTRSAFIQSVQLVTGR